VEIEDPEVKAEVDQGLALEVGLDHLGQGLVLVGVPGLARVPTHLVLDPGPNLPVDAANHQEEKGVPHPSPRHCLWTNLQEMLTKTIFMKYLANMGK